MRRLSVAFVGARRPPSDLPVGYWPSFVRYHLELPWYYSRHAAVDVDLITVESNDYCEDWTELGGGTLRCVTEDVYLDSNKRYDVVIHWRRWFDQLADADARNVILSQDHSYNPDWLGEVDAAFKFGLLDGILVFPTWHEQNTARELRDIIPRDRLYQGLTFGVDTETYFPSSQKDPKLLLWASDPGRGLEQLINPFLRLWSSDHDFRLVVTYPDYVNQASLLKYSSFFRHPGVVHSPNLRNGPVLWDLFNRAGFIPTLLHSQSRPAVVIGRPRRPVQ